MSWPPYPEPGYATAIIRRPAYGAADYAVGLRFETYVSENGAATQFLGQPEADEVIRAAGVSDVSQLEGRACVVEIDGPYIKFVRMWKR